MCARAPRGHDSARRRARGARLRLLAQARDDAHERVHRLRRLGVLVQADRGHLRQRAARRHHLA